jgi:hypothetical protein
MCQITQNPELLALYRQRLAYGQDPVQVSEYVKGLDRQRERPSMEPPPSMVRLTPENVKQYLGYEIVFKSGGKRITRKILSVSESGKSIRVDFPYLHNCLNLSRKIHVLQMTADPLPFGKGNVDEDVIQNNTPILKEEMKITVAPIAGNTTNPSNKNYQEQQQRNSHILDGNMFWCWDDEKSNGTKEGDLFAFYLVESGLRRVGKVIIHRVEKVKDPNDRLSTWSVNVGIRDRNVLELSGPLLELTMDDWVYMGGTKKIQGTYRTIGKKPLFMKDLQNRIMMSELGFM